MFTVTVETSFKAEHQLTMHDGQKEPLHGHDWLVKASVSGDRLDRFGLLIDFKWFRELIEAVIAQFRGQILEQSGCFDGKNASAENVAEYVFQEIEPQMPDHVRLLWVQVAEEKGCWASYSGD